MIENYESLVASAISAVVITGLLRRLEVRFSGQSDREFRIEGRLERFVTKAEIAHLEGILED